MVKQLPTAEIILDSINPNGDRLTSFVCTYHRFIHAEVLTHRLFSRNASSSRAIPVKAMIEKVRASDVMPLHWGQNQKGMVADAEVEDARIEDAQSIWRGAKQQAIAYAKSLSSMGIHKQVVNRLLEPFSPITTIITATDYQNFFLQRCHPSAQPEINALAIAMMEAYQRSNPTQLGWGDYHMPFLKPSDIESGLSQKSLSMIAVGRCARVSYLNHDGTRNPTKDIALYERLTTEKPPHLSPLEHVAIAKDGQYANFTGWQSHRNEIESHQLNLVSVEVDDVSL